MLGPTRELAPVAAPGVASLQRAARHFTQTTEAPEGGTHRQPTENAPPPTATSAATTSSAEPLKIAERRVVGPEPTEAAGRGSRCELKSGAGAELARLSMSELTPYS